MRDGGRWAGMWQWGQRQGVRILNIKMEPLARGWGQKYQGWLKLIILRSGRKEFCLRERGSDKGWMFRRERAAYLRCLVMSEKNERCQDWALWVRRWGWRIRKAGRKVERDPTSQGKVVFKGVMVACQKLLITCVSRDWKWVVWFWQEATGDFEKS